MSRDLEGITVIDLAGIGPSARCVRILADLGARWIRLQPPSRAGRAVVPWHAYGALRGAEQLEFDLKQPGAVDVFLRMAEHVDVVVEGFRPGVTDRLGIGYNRVAAANPGVIYCSATGYGQTGPLADKPGHDINYQAVSGGLALGGRDGKGLPSMPGMTLADSAGGGWQAAMRILAALVARTRTERGRFLDISAAEGVLQLLSLDIDYETATARPAVGTEVHGRFACYSIYGTADGKAMAVGAIEPVFFANLCKVLGLDELAEKQYEPDAQEDLRHAIGVAFLSKSRSEWIAAFAEAEACVTPVLSLDEVRQHPHWQARGAFVDYIHPENGLTTQVGPFGGGNDRGAVPERAPETCHEVLVGLGFSDQEIRDLHYRGVVG